MAAIEKVFKSEDFAIGVRETPWTISGTRYRDSFPQNCNYCYAKGYFSADCVCFVKAYVWGKGVLYNNPGSYWYNPGKYGLGDVTCKQMIDGCDDVSTDMSKIAPGEILYIKGANDLTGHIGVYVGDYTKTINGKTYTYNVTEASPIWRNGIQATYMDANGNRYQCKGGTQSGRWEKHGKLKQVDYGSNSADVPLKYTVKTEGNKSFISVDGKGTLSVESTVTVKAV